MKIIIKIISALFFLTFAQLAFSQQSDNDQLAVMAVLNTFVQAFENGDLQTMQSTFSDKATDFPRAIMSVNNDSPIDNSDYKRVRGLDPQMRMLIGIWDESGDEPPFMTLEPKDLEVQIFTDAALVSFHLEDGPSLSRRSFVFAKEESGWKIVHLHASNVVSSDEF